jgi:PPOX class probable F420-dependent enzyme
MSDGLKQFTKQSYLNLETFRKNGEGVRTPVWFWEDGGVLYVRTEDGSGKVKRARRNPQVRVTPCKMDDRSRAHQPRPEEEIRIDEDLF